MDDESRLAPVPEDDLPAKAETAAPPALTAAEVEARKIVAAIDFIAARLQLESPPASKDKRARAARTVPREFVVAMISAVDALPTLQKRKTFDSDEARLVLQANDAARAVGERVSMFLESIQYTIDVRWKRVVDAALLTYAIASAEAKEPLDRDPANADLPMHVENLRRHLGRKGPRKK